MAKETVRTYKITKPGRHGYTLEDGIYVDFNNHTFKTSDEKTIKVLDGIIESEKDIAVGSRRFLTDDEFIELVTPERITIDYNGKSIHIKDVRKIIDFAVEKGFDIEKIQPKLILEKSKSKISKGTMSGADNEGKK